MYIEGIEMNEHVMNKFSLLFFRLLADVRITTVDARRRRRRRVRANKSPSPPLCCLFSGSTQKRPAL
jgi:hypothetical protein